MWTSLDMNAATPTWTNVTSYPFRQPERVFFNPYQNNMIWVTSFGSGIKSGDMSEVIGIDENSLSLKNKLEIYPNPSSGNFNLNFISENRDESTIEIYNAFGQKVFMKKIKSNLGENNIPLSSEGFSKGIYFVCLKSQQEIKSGRTVVE
ncbi:MAG: T9SS type A sorting domain-containing protein [Bacteroidetes bacterium]|nr:T9SS type A sorting domain-containing protein [Bacteroidota bacterium]